MSTSIFNEFDNEVTRKYKAAAILTLSKNEQNRIPTKYVGIDHQNNVYSVIDYIYNDINTELKNPEGVDLYSIYSKYKITFPYLNQRDIEAIYYVTANQIQIQPQSIENDINKFNKKLFQSVFSIGKSTITTIRGAYEAWVTDYNNMGRVETNKLDRIIEEQKQLDAIKIYNTTNKVIIAQEPKIITTIISCIPVRKLGAVSTDDPKITSEDGVEVFDGVIPSKDTPFIQWNNENGVEHYKIFTGEISEEFNSIGIWKKDFIGKFNSKNTMYIVIWLGDSADRRTGSKYGFCKYSFDSGELEIPYPETIDGKNGKEIIKKRIELALSTVIIDDGKEIGVTSTFIIKHPSDQSFINESALYNAILTVPLFYTYIFIDESDAPLAVKQTIYINYKSLTDELNSKSSEKKISTVKINFNPKEDEKNKNNDTLLISAESKSVNVLKEFIFIFECLLVMYYQLKPNLIGELESIQKGSTGSLSSRQFIQKQEVSNIGDEKNGVLTFDSEITRTKESKIKTLIIKAPEIFSKYARDSGQCPKQPIIIPPDEVQDWKDKGFYKNGKEYKSRQVVPYPPVRENSNDPNNLKVVPIFLIPNNDPRVKYWVVSPDDRSPFIHLKKNKVTSSNYKEFPYVPTCSGKNHLEKTNGTPNLDYCYYTFYEDQKNLDKLNQRTSRGKNNQPISSLMAAAYNEAAKISPQLRNLLQSYLSIDVNDNENFESRGMGHTPSSLLHCACIATRDDKNNFLSRGYEMAITPANKEEYIANQVRPWMSNNILPSVYRQELYDLTDEEIRKKIRDPKEFFDPYTMYRGVEEAFNINIYVFTPQGSVKKIKTGEQREKPILEIPRSRLFHIRPYRSDRRTIIIYKHKGNESDHRYYQHCALIFFKEANKLKDEKESYEMSIEQKVNKGINSGEIMSLPPASINVIKPAISTSIIGSNSTDMYLFGEKVTHKLYNSLYDTMKLYVWSFPENGRTMSGDEIIARDNPYSKVNWAKIFPDILSQRIDGYGKTRALNIKLSNGSIMTICIPPTQPLLLPTDTTVYPVDSSLAVKVFSESPPSGYHRNGIWFPVIDFKWGIFVPTTDTDVKETDFVPPPPIFIGAVSEKQFSPSTNPIMELNRIRRLAYFLTTLIIWCWRSSSISIDEPRDIRTWWSTYTISDSKVSEVPGTANISRYLPKFKSSRDCIIHLVSKWPSYFQSDGYI